MSEETVQSTQPCNPAAPAGNRPTEAVATPAEAPAPSAVPGTGAIESPPPAQRPQPSADDPRTRLHQLAGELRRTRNRALTFEFLRLRRALA